MISHTEIIFQLFLSAILGGLIGLERELKSWFAGLRTHMLVCMGSTLIMIVSQYGFEEVLVRDLVVLDPSRVAAQVVSGMGFLGAGTILFLKNKIRGLTTAASLWAIAAVGLSVGGGLYLAAIATTLLVLIVLAGIKPLERIFSKKETAKEMKFSIQPGISLDKLEGILIKLNLRSHLKSLRVESEEKKEWILLSFKDNPPVSVLKIVNEIKNLSEVEQVEVVEP